MPEKVNERTIFSLLEVTLSIRKTLEERYTSSFWVKAEMNKLNLYPQSGHCYPDLVEKTDGKIVAEIRSTIWKDDFQRINDNFLNILHEPLKNGINILFSARVSYHPVHGLSLRILDIDPSWSLGELEKEKQQTIEKMRREGLFDRNRSLALALLPKRIAIISVGTSKGYADFRKVIDGNGWGYNFFHMLFPALLQGENAVESLIAALEKIRSVKSHFDVVAIIRGGGGDVGLTCYNNYMLSKAIALFPLPVITGIGHSTNETVAEMVAFHNTITPTDLADYLIQKFHNFSVPVQKAQETIVQHFTRMITDEKLRILNAVRYFRSVALAGLTQRKNEISHEIRALQQESKYWLQQKRASDIHQNVLLIEKGSRRILMAQDQVIGSAGKNVSEKIQNFIRDELQVISAIEKNVELLDPVNIFNRGYSITVMLDGGKVLKTVDDVGQGARLKTMLADGNIISITQWADKSKKHE
ncbi:MAG: exodeoxyribonuclease VII large subunit [Bacteroidales bacterium]